MRTSLLEADSCVASLVSSGRPECLVVPTRAPSYAVRGDCALGHAVPVNESLLSHFEHPLRPSLQLGITIRDAMALEASSLAQSEALSYAMWVLSGLLGFVRLQDFTPADPALFNQLVTAFPRALPIRPFIPPSYVIAVASSTCLTSPLILVMSQSVRCSLPLLFSQIRFFVRRMFLARWRRHALHHLSSHSKPW